MNWVSEPKQFSVQLTEISGRPSLKPKPNQNFQVPESFGSGFLLTNNLNNVFLFFLPFFQACH